MQKLKKYGKNIFASQVESVKNSKTCIIFGLIEFTYEMESWSVYGGTPEK